MEKIQRVKKREKIDLKDLETINKITGEVDEFKNAYIYRDINLKVVNYHCDHYVYVNTERIFSLIKNEMNLSEIGLLMAISIKLKPLLNICLQDDDKPHTTSSISKIIGYSQHRTKKKLDKLVELGIIGYQKIQGHEGLGKVYHINPHYVRIGYNYSETIPILFNNTIEEYKRNKLIKQSFDQVSSNK